MGYLLTDKTTAASSPVRMRHLRDTLLFIDEAYADLELADRAYKGYPLQGYVPEYHEGPVDEGIYDCMKHLLELKRIAEMELHELERNIMLASVN